jgi:formylglycine-generating enzyme
MVPVTPPDGGTYCVDSTEVTVEQYAAFLVNPPDEQPPMCTWNASFTPSAGWPPVNGSENLPVTFVDWCDAFAYCAWAGKHLCGKIGGGPNAPADLADATKSQWYNACSAQGEQTYPYGSTYMPASCNGADYPSPDTVLDVGTADCHGGFPELHDMSGNVWEWEDSCTGDGGMNDTCQTRGGAYDSLETALTCGHGQAFYRSAAAVSGGYIGFRCCAF